MAREKKFHVYVMASKGRVLYVGVTGFLMARVLQHKAGETGGFKRVPMRKADSSLRSE